MTEHIDFIGNNMFFYGKKLYRNNDYMSQKTKIQRIMGLIECAPFFSSIVTLGDLPQLLGIELFLPDVPVIRLPFPKLSFIEKNNYTPQYDFLFIGALTKYRRDFIKNLFRGGFNICYPNYQRNFFISRKLRNDYIHKSKIILNVPQVRD
ncbi:hypothetical protein E5P55_00775 [Candidatus Pinguicoccus supinus]|uniref:Uncharacterized protein n=1 Tax=Candidatus Pinguicoccus supinus TaxID=2529394 RepID=A0A7T0BSI7_9BACT|nr:hypothetical protein E5P55_00775 [Candidatus Pinguicoccus supinus]